MTNSPTMPANDGRRASGDDRADAALASPAPMRGQTAIGYEHLRVGVLELDAQQNIVGANDAFCALFACTRDEIIGKRLDDLFSKKDKRGMHQFYSKMSAYTGGTLDCHLVLTIGGRDSFTRVRMVSLPQGGFAAYVENTLLEHDLTYQLLVAEERLRGLFKDSDDGIVVLSEDLRIVEFNERFYEIMRFRSAHGVPLSDEALPGKILTKLLPRATFASLVAALEDPARDEMRTSAVVDERHLEMKVSRISVPLRGMVGTCLVVRDVSQQKQLERARESQAHFAGMAEVATEVLHNLGNMCGSILYASEKMLETLTTSAVKRLERANALLQAHLDDPVSFIAHDPKGKLLPEFYVRLGEELSTQQRFLLERAQDLFAKVQLMKDAIAAQQTYATGSLFFESVSLMELLHEVLRLQKDTFDRHGTEVVVEGHVDGVVRVLRAKLAHVLLNLLKNAAEATVVNERSNRRVRVRAGRAADGAAFIHVEDNGSGVEKEHLPKLFSHGFTTKKDGHGFGLHFCATAMKEMAGTIQVTSEGPGRGAAFTLTFPPHATTKVDGKA